MGNEQTLLALPWWMLSPSPSSVSHVLQASGLSWKEGQLDFTGAQMVLTLKLIAIGVCYQDSRIAKDVR